MRLQQHGWECGCNVACQHTSAHELADQKGLHAQPGSTMLPGRILLMSGTLLLLSTDIFNVPPPSPVV